MALPVPVRITDPVDNLSSNALVTQSDPANAATFITVDAAVPPAQGTVPALGANQLMTLDITDLPAHVRSSPGFREKFVVWAQALDGNVTRIEEDAVEFDPATGTPTAARFRVDINASGAVKVLLRHYHSIGA